MAVRFSSSSISSVRLALRSLKCSIEREMFDLYELVSSGCASDYDKDDYASLKQQHELVCRLLLHLDTFKGVES